jgi:signal transduction histidine kinase
MTTISGFVDGMLDGTIPKEKHSEYLQIVSNEVKRLSRLVVSMLNLSKIEAGELELKYSNFDISSTIIDCLLNFEQEIEKKNIEVLGLDEIGSVIVSADRDMIHQVVYNLVDNAVKFTNENGEISVSVEEDGGKYSISIQNTGEGVSPDEIGRIFERFYKVDKSRSYDVKSAGLGLYLCKTIIDMHAGKISAESVQGQYIRFTISLEKAMQEKAKK